MEDILKSSDESSNEEELLEENNEEWSINIKNKNLLEKYNNTKYGISSKYLPILS